MADLGTLIGASIAFLFGLVFILIGLRSYFLARKIRNLPTSKARSAAAGLSEFYGKAEPLKEMVSPISKRKCAYWKVVVKSIDESKGKGEWHFINEFESPSIFYLKDHTGKILVDSKGAEIMFTWDHFYRGYLGADHGNGKQLEKKVLEFIESLDSEAREKLEMHRKRMLQFYEYIITDDDDIYVIGSTEPLKDSGSELVVRKNPIDRIMLISVSSEDFALSHLNITAELIIGFMFIAAGLYMVIDAFGGV